MRIIKENEGGQREDGEDIGDEKGMESILLSSIARKNREKEN